MVTAAQPLGLHHRPRPAIQPEDVIGQKEVDQLVTNGFLAERRSGNRRYLRAREGHPLFRPLREILMRSEGLVPVLAAALGRKGVDLALVFGSFAAGTPTPESDVDLLIVGPIDLREAVRRLAPARDTLGREINPIVWTREELDLRRSRRDPFARRVLTGPRLMVIGEESELAGLG
jgi:predicted nucleotidyltransferase